MTSVGARFFAVVAGCIWLSGCSFDDMVATGPERHDSIHLDSANIERSNIELNMGAGEMILNGGAQKLVDGTFTYNVDAWKPIVTDSTNGDHAAVTIKQPDRGRGGGKTKYIWDLTLNDHVLTDLSINCGAGQAQINLATLDPAQSTSSYGAPRKCGLILAAGTDARLRSKDRRRRGTSGYPPTQGRGRLGSGAWRHRQCERDRSGKARRPLGKRSLQEVESNGETGSEWRHRRNQDRR